MMDAVLTIESDDRKRSADLLARELVEIGRRCAARLEPPFHSSDHVLLYGDDGLPA